MTGERWWRAACELQIRSEGLGGFLFSLRILLFQFLPVFFHYNFYCFEKFMLSKISSNLRSRPVQ